MEKRDDGIIEVEAGDEILVVMAKHADWSTVPVGTFTSYRLANVGAKAYADEYGKNDDGVRGAVVSTHVHSTCLDQHGVCPEVSQPTPRAAGAASVFHDFGPRCGRLDAISAAPTPHPGPYSKESLYKIPDYSLLVGPARVAECKPVVWDLFAVLGCSHGDTDEATRRIGLPVILQEPEIDYEVARPHEDDFDAALSYLRSGGALCKVPDRPGSTCFRLLVVLFPGSPVRGNCT
jgi:hypothetical protein